MGPTRSSAPAPRDLRVVGVDGCKGGWVAVVLVGGVVADAGVYRDFEALLAAAPDTAVFGVDIPIGLPKIGMREVDTLARQLLRPRGSTLFPMPPREVLAAASHQEALALAKTLGLPGISAQTWSLRAKIFEVERYLPRARIVEVHPELCFREMAGEPVIAPKRSWNGFLARRQLLERHGLVLPDALPSLERAAVDDVVDATAAAWTAHRVACEQATIVTAPAQPGITIYA